MQHRRPRSASATHSPQTPRSPRTAGSTSTERVRQNGSGSSRGVSFRELLGRNSLTTTRWPTPLAGRHTVVSPNPGPQTPPLQGTYPWLKVPGPRPCPKPSSRTSHRASLRQRRNQHGPQPLQRFLHPPSRHPMATARQYGMPSAARFTRGSQVTAAISIEMVTALAARRTLARVGSCTPTPRAGRSTPPASRSCC